MTSPGWPPAAADRDLLGRLGQRLRVIPGRGACKHPDGATRMAASALDAFADDVRAHASGQACRAPSARVSPPPEPARPGGRAVSGKLRSIRSPAPGTGSALTCSPSSSAGTSGASQ